jgi:hypothetical protein
MTETLGPGALLSKILLCKVIWVIFCKSILFQTLANDKSWHRLTSCFELVLNVSTN